MTTSSEMDLDSVKEVLVYHAVVDYIKNLKKSATPETSLMVMSSSYGQEFGGYKTIIYSMKKWHEVTVEGMKKYITEKYAEILKTEKEFKWHQEEVVPNMLYVYNFYTKSDNYWNISTSRLNYHEICN